MLARSLKPSALTSVPRSVCGTRCMATSALPSYLLNTPPTQVTTLPNQFRVASQHHHGETATVGVWIDAGSCWETPETSGVAHFLEHMAFKGTAKRTQEKIEKEIENIGGFLNAYTSREQTVYYAKVFKDDVAQAVDILSDILQNSTLSERDIERERGVILQEMDFVEGQPNEVIFDYLHSIAYQGTPLGQTILGPEKNVRNLKREDLVKYISTHYTGPRMVLAACGPVEHTELADMAEQKFGGLSSDVNVDMGEQRNVDFTGSMVHVRDDALSPIVHTAVAAEGVSWTDPNYFVFMVLQSIVGDWDRSLGAGKNVCSRVGETYATEGLAHSLTSFNTSYHHTGLFGAYIVGDYRSTYGDAIYEVLNEWVRIGQSVTPAEVDRAKNKLKSSFLMQLDGTTAICEDIGRQLLTVKRYLSPAEVFLRIDSITPDQVRGVANHYLQDVDVAVAAVGHVDGKYFPDYNQIRSWTSWMRL